MDKSLSIALNTPNTLPNFSQDRFLYLGGKKGSTENSI